MKKVLIINAYYYPGWRSGGPQQTIMNIVDVFGSQSQIYILTHNHDMGEQVPYPDISMMSGLLWEMQKYIILAVKTLQ